MNKKLLMLFNEINEVRNSEDLEPKFEFLAKYLMNNLCLNVGGTKYSFTEIEVYYKSSCHNDIYTHGAPEQLSPGKWYFNGFGLDITFGNKEKNAFGGLLIRGVKKEDNTNIYINGPSNVLKELFSNTSIFNNNGLFLTEKSKISDSRIYKTQRIGLSKKEDDIVFFDKEYRYLADLKQDHAFKDKEKVIKQLLKKKDIKEEEVEGILGYRLKNRNMK